MPDKFAATWVSHSSISDFTRCPRSYFLKNVYKDPRTGHKIQIITPALALGSIVHEVIEGLSVLPVEKRFTTPLLQKYQTAWKKIAGEQGGFYSQEQEEKYYQAGVEMLQRVTQNPGPIGKKAVKIKEDLPWFWLSQQDEIILCGKIDWLEYLPDQDAVHIIDFKTSKQPESAESLQLPIYYLLSSRTQSRPVHQVSYWYLRLQDRPIAQDLPDETEAFDKVFTIATKIKTARKLNHFSCPNGDQGCNHCLPFERILQGEGKLVGENEYRQDVYVLPFVPNSQGDQPDLAADIL